MKNAVATTEPVGRKRKASTPLRVVETSAARLVPSSPELFPLSTLRRAAENVRHTRIDEDIVSLADDIAAHGLLQSLIGYADDAGLIHVVGGGRRFQALRHLEDEGVVDGSWKVPVLIRHVDEAIELSLAENLQQRTMSPVDEFLAFRALMERGDTSPATLAKRFGFTERVVKQRLRLAELAPEILDALAGREITIDAAMAYAASQDRQLQSEVFKAETKKSWEPHRPRDIRNSLAMKGIRTDNPLFKFVGEDGYTRRGGEFDDDLFNEDKGTERSLANPGLLLTAARDMIALQMERRLADFQARPDLAPTIIGYLVAADLRVKDWGNTAPKPPAGFVAVEKYSSEGMWKTIRNNGIDVHVLVGIDNKGELTVWPRTVFVPKDQKNAIDPPQAGYQPETPEERAARERENGVARLARRFAVGSFAGTALDGRATWPRWGNDEPATVGGQKGWHVQIMVFVPDAAIGEQRSAAEAEYDREVAGREEAERAEKQKRAQDEARWKELLEAEPPAIVVVDGEAWGRAEDGTYAPLDEQSDGHAASWTGLVTDFRWALDEIGETFATREQFDAAMQVVASADEVAA